MLRVRGETRRSGFRRNPESPRTGNREHNKDFLDTGFRQYDGLAAGRLPQT